MENMVKTELPACPVETTLTLIGDKWKVLILRDLMPGTKRFGELKKSIGGVSQKVLTAQSMPRCRRAWNIPSRRWASVSSPFSMPCLRGARTTKSSTAATGCNKSCAADGERV